MIVSKEHNFLFLHVPKTGGTMAQDIFNVAIRGNEDYLSVIGSAEVTRKDGTLTISLNDADVARRTRLHGRESYPYEMRELEIPAFLKQITIKAGGPRTLQKHSDVNLIKRFFLPQFYSACAKVIMVRNPYSRTYSAYKYLVRTEGKVPGSCVREGERIVTIDEFLDEGRCTNTVAGMHQVNWYDADAENFHVFRLEDFENSIRQIVRDIMKVSPQVFQSVEHTLMCTRNTRSNASTSGPDEWKRMSPETRKRIERVYRADFEAFGY